MANEKSPEESVEQRINKEHSGIFSASSRSGEFLERDAVLDFYEDLVDFDPLSFNGLCGAIHWDILGFHDPAPMESLFHEGSPPKRDHDLIQKLLELLPAHNTSAEADRCFALAVQLGMAYQRLLLRPAEGMAKAHAKTRTQRQSLSKGRQKITADKACELCEKIRGAEEELDTRSVARKAAAQYKQENGTDVLWSTIHRHWMRAGEDWRKRRDREMRDRELQLEYFAKLKGMPMQQPDSCSGPGENDIP
ncbi:MAG: hypothetical protein U0992_17355 [Planctomycetaceae bacterium]